MAWNDGQACDAVTHDRSRQQTQTRPEPDRGSSGQTDETGSAVPRLGSPGVVRNRGSGAGQWQALVPESVNVRPATGRNFQS
jgi:hypothetical protein